MYFSNVVVGILAAQAMSNDRRPSPAQAGKYAALMAAAALPVSGAPLMGLIEPRMVSHNLPVFVSSQY
jgi:hypothetical protein